MKSVFTKEYGAIISVLIDARKEKHLSQKDLADKLGRPQSFVSKYERGERRLDVIEFIGVARALGLKAAKIVAELENALSSSSGSGGRK